MTLCIAGIWGRAGGRAAIVTVSDMEMSEEGVSLDLAATKLTLLDDNRWLCMYCGDPCEFEEIMDYVRRGMASSDPGTVSDVIAIVESAYRTAIERRTGIAKSTGDRERLKKIEASGTGTELLIGGFDDTGTPHLFASSTFGKCTLFDGYRFHAIGTGAWLASPLLFLRSGLRYRTDISRFAYGLCEAKFFAEAADGVGKETMVKVLYHDGTSAGTILHTGQQRAAWERVRDPEITDDAVGELEATLNWDTRSLIGRRE
jgi:20S proteasome alpha/beta subunit